MFAILFSLCVWYARHNIPNNFEENPESTELWSPGSPAFPSPELVAERDDATESRSITQLLNSLVGTLAGYEHRRIRNAAATRKAL